MLFQLIIVFALSFASNALEVSSFNGSSIIQPCRYYIYTRNNPQSPQMIFHNLNGFEGSFLSRERTTVILVHGHGGSPYTTLNPDVKNALLTAEDVNVIVMGWTEYSSLTYSTAVLTVPLVAEYLAEFITNMVNANLASLDNIHIVGFNLGAHIAGIASRSLNRIARITGLDPSGNHWGVNSARLRVTDANYVEVIHTDGSGRLANGIGTALGHVDFFANGGSNQPGCITHSCSHSRAYELFAASMINANLVGYPCSSALQLNLNMCRGLPLRMGTNDLTKIGIGIYRINTRRSYPF